MQLKVHRSEEIRVMQAEGDAAGVPSKPALALAMSSSAESEA